MGSEMTLEKAKRILMANYIGGTCWETPYDVECVYPHEDCDNCPYKKMIIKALDKVIENEINNIRLICYDIKKGNQK